MREYRTKPLVLVAAIALSLSGCTFLLHSNCENTVKSEIQSPDGRYAATLFERNCGATTDFSTIVSLRESSVRFKGDDLGVVIVKGQRKLDLVWDSNTKLRLRCHDCRADDIFKQERTWKDIDISLVN
jgi:hypothetical protein